MSVGGWPVVCGREGLDVFNALSGKTDGTTVAIAGRRIDASDADYVRFSEANVSYVEAAVREALDGLATAALVSSAANGADLLAAKWAVERGIPLHLILPFGVDDFKRTSVLDRAGEWGPLYDRVVQYARERHSLETLSKSADDASAFLAANHVILEKTLQSGDHPAALIIWDGHSRGPDDITAAFLSEARRRGIKIHEVLTTV